MRELEFYAINFMPYPYVPPGEEVESSWVVTLRPSMSFACQCRCSPRPATKPSCFSIVDVAGSANVLDQPVAFEMTCGEPTGFSPRKSPAWRTRCGSGIGDARATPVPANKLAMTATVSDRNIVTETFYQPNRQVKKDEARLGEAFANTP